MVTVLLEYSYQYLADVNEMFIFYSMYLLQNNTCSVAGKRLLFTRNSEVPLQHVLTQPFVFGPSRQPETSIPSYLRTNDEYSDNFDSTSSK